MRGWRIAIVLLLLGAGAAAFWMSRSEPGDGDASADDTAPVAYDYEANDVVMRQMGPDGRMAFQIEAKEITQLPDTGKVTARGITLYHDPPGTEPGGPNRLTLTADNDKIIDGNVLFYPDTFDVRGSLETDAGMASALKDYFKIPSANIVQNFIRLDGDARKFLGFEDTEKSAATSK